MMAIVESHLEWVKKKPDLAKHLMEMRHADFMATAEGAIARANNNFVEAFVKWLKPNVKTGKIKRLAPDLFFSLVLGPCQEYVRIWLGGDTITDISVATRELANAARLVVRSSSHLP